MPLNLDLANPVYGFSLGPGVTLNITRVDNAGGDPGRTVHRTWELSLTGGSESLLDGVQVQTSWTDGGALFYEGSDITAPVPDHHWPDIQTSVGGGKATGTLDNVPSNPSLLALAT